ncbi:hypothetical protein HTZ84_20985 [Haloterrigena sp. SYSU A558-1]|uniref:Uncharacterized protein n=1 Tax=Haloterrigena gelatinilytica TaxID=2741724 RepID=A0ABX2LER3_9EURY|nr:hypothetical protein [Haloterrigena gelatinilytica]NUC74740.1 hypothetical protein [Haloterrigena gelatinilytica]
MNDFVQLLGWLLIGLTFIGSYRLAAYLARPRSSLYPLLIATTLTAVFIVIVDVVILVTGLLVITLPTVWILRKLGVHNYTLLPSLDRFRDRGLELPRPSLPGTSDRGTAISNRVTTVLDRVDRLLHRLEHLALDRSPEPEDDTVSIEFDDDHWNDHG